MCSVKIFYGGRVCTEFPSEQISQNIVETISAMIRNKVIIPRKSGFLWTVIFAKRNGMERNEREFRKVVHFIETVWDKYQIWYFLRKM